ncbi:response regulator transcription factor [Sphingomonas aerophila]|jgi:LuxR family transcriptional regulator of spore coat protein|uniref:DNA-binding CsgD family transcriptional regulator n=1 Tax=Sphingomonas aerophila TaxID=1344948 RepID=A0A7W9BBW0_9SPHN|nr:helix-turn-helix transcriptional regulator [Sphingomonas aerophila]MBB5714360.1 DNA-binding CsgD family transcriptional regulator [Sphingomonas aerophila]
MNSLEEVEPQLTDRELRILSLVARGYSAKQAALELGIAPRTVEKHIDHVRLKIRAKNRTHMVAQAIARQLI